MKYRNREIVEARQFSLANRHELKEWCNGWYYGGSEDLYFVDLNMRGLCVTAGYWIVKTELGFKLLSPGEFAKQYELLHE